METSPRRQEVSKAADRVKKRGDVGEGGSRGGTHLLLTLRHLAIDHASLSRRSAVHTIKYLVRS